MTMARRSERSRRLLLGEPSPAWIFLLFAPLIFLTYALITPPFQTYDENQHLYRAWQISSFTLTSERRGSHVGGELPPGLAAATVKEIGSVVAQGKRIAVVRPFSEIFGSNTPIGHNQPRIYYDFFGAALYSPVSYMPQTVAIWTGEATGLSVEWTLRLGRILNCLICIGLIWWSLTLIPFGRWIMAIIALSPPTAASAASFGQDALVIGAGFLLIALGLRAAAQGQWPARKVIVFALAAIAITLSKIVYLPLVAVAAVPKPRAISWPRWILAPMLAGILSAVLLFVWIHLNAHAIVTFRPSLPTISEQLSWALSHPIGFCAMIARTYFVGLPSIWGQLYAFGDSTVPTVLAAEILGTAAVFVAMISGEPADTDLSRTRRTWMLLVFSAVAVLIATTMFLVDTMRGAVFIHGIQGRYFLPAVPLAAIALTRRGVQSSAMMIAAAVSLVTVANLITLRAIMGTFYSF